MTTMAVARFPGGGTVRVEREPLAEPDPGAVRVRAEWVGLCGSDKRLLRDGSAFVPGHEIAARVVEAGAAVTGAPAPGTRVLVYIPLFCGACRNCDTGDTNRCLHLDRLVGWHADGGFREYLDLPAANLLPIPDDIGSDVAVLALDTLGTAGHGLRMAQRAAGGTPGHTVVIGCGPLGNGAVAAARELFGTPVLAHDLVPARLDAAVDLGATAMGEDVARNDHPLVVEVTGSEAGRRLAWELVEPGGVLLLLGEGGTDVSFPMGPRWRRTDMTILRSFYFPLHEVEPNWDLVRAVGPRLRDVLCVETRFDDLEDTYRAFGAGEHLKPLVRIPDRATDDPDGDPR